MVFTGMGSARDLEVRISGDASELSEAIDGAVGGLNRLKKVAGLASAAVAALGVAGFATAANEARNFEDAMVEVEKVTDPQTAREMGDAIQEMAETIPLAQEELAQITADAGRFGIEGTENIQAFTESVSRMAVATDLSSTEAGEALARLATLTDTPITQIENLGSVINELSNNMATSSSEIVDSMLRSSAALAQLGLNQSEMAGLSAALNEVSESSERAGTRLRRVAQELMDPKKAEDLAGALGMSADQFVRMRDESPVDLITRLGEAMREGGAEADALRGVLASPTQQALAALSQNLDGVNDSLAMASSQFEENTSLQKEFDTATDTFNSRLQTTQNRLRNVAIETGNSLLPALTDLLGLVNTAVGGFQDLNEATDGLIGQLTLLTAVAGGTAGALALLGVGGAGPVGAIIAGAGLVGLAWTNNLYGIRDTTLRVAQDMLSIWARVTDTMSQQTAESVEGQMGIWERGEIRMAGIFDSIGTTFVNEVDKWVTVVEVFGQKIGELLEAASLARQGKLDQAREVTDRLMEESDLESEFRERAQERRRGLLNRQRDRTGTIAQSDRSLLPRSQSGMPRWQKEMQETEEQWRKQREQYQKQQEEWRQQLLEESRANRGANEQAAGTLEGSAIDGGRCDLSEYLLEPFEQVASSGSATMDDSTGERTVEKNTPTGTQEVTETEFKIFSEVNLDGKKIGEITEESTDRYTGGTGRLVR